MFFALNILPGLLPKRPGPPTVSPNNTNTNNEMQTTGDAAATSERLHRETEAAIRQVQADVAASKAGVVEMLARHATTVAPPQQQR